MGCRLHCSKAGSVIFLLGSEYYVDSLSPDERKLIACNVNIDMIASPNYIRAIYDGRNAEDQSIRGGSGAIQGMFEEFFDSAGLTHTPRPFDGRSDYGPVCSYFQSLLTSGLLIGGVFAPPQWRRCSCAVRVISDNILQFIARGIPAGGVATGAETLKTLEEVQQ